MADQDVTLEDIRAAAQWAQACLDKKGDRRLPINGSVRRYDQSQWDCGTACCIWGAAHLLAKGTSSPNGPSYSWTKQSHLHWAVWFLLIQPSTEPADVLELLK